MDPNLAANIAALYAQRAAILAKLAELPMVSASEEGRSFSAGDRASLFGQLKEVGELIAAMQGPFAVTSVGY